MMRLMRRAAAELGKTVVLVLHDINFASCYSDQIVAMKHGKVAAQGNVDEMIRPEVLSAIYEMEIAVHEIGGQRIGVYYE
jgi:iron complex transport system ATP-binding protein